MQMKHYVRRYSLAGNKSIVYSININQIMKIVRMILFTIKSLILKIYIYMKEISVYFEQKNPV